jgi:hypothetical protein
VTDDLARRMADNQLAMARDSLARDARRLVHAAANLLLDAARLDGMTHFNALVPDNPKADQ